MSNIHTHYEPLSPTDHFRQGSSSEAEHRHSVGLCADDNRTESVPQSVVGGKTDSLSHKSEEPIVRLQGLQTQHYASKELVEQDVRQASERKEQHQAHPVLKYIRNEVCKLHVKKPYMYDGLIRYMFC